MEPPPAPEPSVPAPQTPAPSVWTVLVQETWNPLARDVTVTRQTAGPIALGCRDVADPQSERHLVESTDEAVEHVLAVTGLRADTTYDCRVAAPDLPEGPAAEFEVVTEPLTGIVPTLTAIGDAVPPGYVLAAYKPDGCSMTSWLMIFDTHGQVRWRWPLPDGTQVDVEALLHQGQVVWGGGGRPNSAGVIDLIEGEVHRVSLPDAPIIHHDARRLDDGRMLTLELQLVDGPGGPFAGFGIRRHDPSTGVVDWSYDSTQAVDAGVLQPGFVDPWHANWIDRVSDPVHGELTLVSLCFTSQVLAISEATGEVVWVFGEGGDFTLTQGAWPECQHGLEFDGTELLAYDNGLFSGQSAAVIYSVDPDARTVTETWRWTEPGWFEETLGDVDWLPDGTVWITRAHPECWALGSPGAHSEFIEVDPATDVEIWRLRFDVPQDTIYRSERVDGCALFQNVSECATLAGRWADLELLLWGAR